MQDTSAEEVANEVGIKNRMDRFAWLVKDLYFFGSPCWESAVARMEDVAWAMSENQFIPQSMDTISGEHPYNIRGMQLLSFLK